jgi:hypothetical protein
MTKPKPIRIHTDKQNLYTVMVEMMVDRCNRFAYLSVFYATPNHGAAQVLMAIHGCRQWIVENYPMAVVQRDLTWALEMHAADLRPEHAEHLPHPTVEEPTELTRDTAYEDGASRWTPIFPESETYPGQRILPEYKHSNGAWYVDPHVKTWT